MLPWALSIGGVIVLVIALVLRELKGA